MNKKQRANSFIVFEKLVKVVSKCYKQSVPAANVTTSFLPTGEWYFSIVTFKGAKKHVELSCKNKDMLLALNGLVTEFLKDKVAPTDLDTLNVMVRGK